jgi:cobalamin biosynthesis protein CbiG
VEIRTHELFVNLLKFAMTHSKIWIGIGCRRGTSKEQIQTAIAQVLKSHALEQATVLGIATVDRKSNEPGLLEYCQDQALPLRYFSAVRLKLIPVPNPSSTVALYLETSSVAEAAAMCAAEAQNLKVTKQVIQGVTIAIAEQRLKIAIQAASI